MELNQLVSVSRLENAWSRLSSDPDFQRGVTSFFKAPHFYVGCSGLFAGTNKATGRRAVYCDLQCYQRLSSELAARVAVWVQQSSPPQLPTENVDDVQALDLKTEGDVKALFKDFKRFARFQKQSRQQAAARELLFNVRRWTAPFTAAPAAAENQTAWSSPADVPSHPVPAEPGSSSQFEDEGACGDQNTGSISVRTGSVPANTESTVATRSALALKAPAFSAASHEWPALSVLRSAACSDPWVSTAPDFGRLSAPLASCGSSGIPSSAETPLCPPGTPRSALVTSGVASPLAAGGTPLCDSDSEFACPDGPSPGLQPPCGAAGVTTSAAELDVRTASGLGCCPKLGGGAEGVLVVFCSIDLEWWERDNSRVTEVGWTMWDNLTRQMASRHHIVAETEALVNRIYVPNHKHDFLFGRSTTNTLAKGAAALQSDLAYYGERIWRSWWEQQREKQEQQQPDGWQGNGQPNHHDTARPPADAGMEAGQGARALEGGPWKRALGLAAAASPASWKLPPLPPIQLVVVGHGLYHDLRALYHLVGVVIPPEAAVVDTAELAWAALDAGPDQERNPVSLRVLLKMLGIPAAKLHNGGNDARYTLEAMLALAALEPKSAVVQA